MSFSNRSLDNRPNGQNRSTGSQPNGSGSPIQEPGRAPGRAPGFRSAVNSLTTVNGPESSTSAPVAPMVTTARASTWASPAPPTPVSAVTNGRSPSLNNSPRISQSSEEVSFPISTIASLLISFVEDGRDTFTLKAQITQANDDLVALQSGADSNLTTQQRAGQVREIASRIAELKKALSARTVKKTAFGMLIGKQLSEAIGLQVSQQVNRGREEVELSKAEADAHRIALAASAESNTRKAIDTINNRIDEVEMKAYDNLEITSENIERLIHLKERVSELSKIHRSSSGGDVDTKIAKATRKINAEIASVQKTTESLSKEMDESKLDSLREEMEAFKKSIEVKFEAQVADFKVKLQSSDDLNKSLQKEVDALKTKEEARTKQETEKAMQEMERTKQEEERVKRQDERNKKEMDALRSHIDERTKRGNPSQSPTPLMQSPAASTLENGNGVLIRGLKRRVEVIEPQILELRQAVMDTVSVQAIQETDLKIFVEEYLRKVVSDSAGQKTRDEDAAGQKTRNEDATGHSAANSDDEDDLPIIQRVAAKKRAIAAKASDSEIALSRAELKTVNEGLAIVKEEMKTSKTTHQTSLASLNALGEKIQMLEKTKAAITSTQYCREKIDKLFNDMAAQGHTVAVLQGTAKEYAVASQHNADLLRQYSAAIQKLEGDSASLITASLITASLTKRMSQCEQKTTVQQKTTSELQARMDHVTTTSLLNAVLREVETRQAREGSLAPHDRRLRALEARTMRPLQGSPETKAVTELTSRLQEVTTTMLKVQGDSDARLTAVQARVDDLTGIISASSNATAGARLDAVETRLTSLADAGHSKDETRFEAIEMRVDVLEDKHRSLVEQHNGRVTGCKAYHDLTHAKLSSVHVQINEMEEKLNSNFDAVASFNDHVVQSATADDAKLTALVTQVKEISEGQNTDAARTIKLVADSATLQNQIATLQNHIATFDKTNTTIATRQQQIRTEVDQILPKMQDANDRMNALRTELPNMRQDIDGFRGGMMVSEQKLAGVNTAINAASTDISQIHGLVADIRDLRVVKRKYVKSEIEPLRSALDAQIRRVDELEHLWEGHELDESVTTRPAIVPRPASQNGSFVVEDSPEFEERTSTQSKPPPLKGTAKKTNKPVIEHRRRRGKDYDTDVSYESDADSDDEIPPQRPVSTQRTVRSDTPESRTAAVSLVSTRGKLNPPSSSSSSMKTKMKTGSSKRPASDAVGFDTPTQTAKKAKLLNGTSSSARPSPVPKPSAKKST